MRLFNCLVRVAGDIKFEVRKEDVTAAEIVVLRTIHTPEGSNDEVVVDIKTNGRTALGEDGQSPRADKEERARLQELYGPALTTIDGVKNINGIFGVAGRLPVSVEGIPGEVMPEDVAASKRTRVAPMRADELADLEAAA